MKQSVLAVNNLNISVQERLLIKSLSFVISDGSLTCITGDNGVGKTTLIKTLLRSVETKNEQIDFSVKKSDIQLVPQFRDIDDEYPLRIQDFVALSLQKGMLPWLKKEEKIRLKRVLSDTNLTDIANESLGRASGGEKQRAYLAQALITDPRLLILDESTANLDKKSRHILLALVKTIIKNKSLAVIFITHDPELVDLFGDYELHIENKTGTFKKLTGEDADV
ncbi:ATP-binding cassette domain-containing protein [Leuconostoc fallax]|uniref:ABC transporter domain-containing protein n=1 Tax=Leuconostoc fallax TaxID=1251 RepID=A0A4R5N9N4_9LACO|nr:ATP-binding cassette domain-containing protein [Leuconostoc fallax]MBU7455970.1 ATP-binding cassette domain-containing protein [Leuconostoc fallax]MCO6184346.1 ATP-binding cassette domain-containing protein [Leuconostoc fallax]TDG68814.1 hypothetical protein C5L23_000733 [Leuconostoc fallax]